MRPIKIIIDFFGKSPGRAKGSLKDGSAIQRWSSDLKGLSLRLDGMIAASEETFLSLGEKLRDFHQRSQEMCSFSGKMVGIMTGQALSETLEGLSSILEELQTSLSNPEDGLSRTIWIFQEHEATLKKVSSSLQGLNMLVLNLSMLGFLTQVENAYISTHNTGFSSLTDDVRKLSELIRQKSSQIGATTDTVLSYIAQAKTKVEDFKSIRGEQMDKMMDKTLTSHGRLAGKLSANSVSVRTIEQDTRDITSSIGDIVMSMQFHDITRQQLEHVKEVLDNLCTRINTSESSPWEVAAFVRDVCSLQLAQIGRSKDEFVQNVGRIIRNLDVIGASVGDIRKVSRDAALTSEADGVSFIQDMEAGISSMISGMKDSVAEQSRITETVNSASEMASQMAMFANDIETLGMNLQLIALNARIKAAHLGSEGAALDTISGGIYELSHTARQDTRHLGGMLSDLVAASSTFQEDYNGMQACQEQQVEGIVERLGHIIASLRQLDREVHSMLTGLSFMSETLMKDIQDTARSITIHEELRAKLEDAIALIEEVASSAKKMYPAAKTPETSSFFLDIDRLYTMESEREIHQRHMGAGALPGKNINRPAAGDDLGDNVELF